MLEFIRLLVLPVDELIGTCDTMEATFCMNNEPGMPSGDITRMFDQYLYKVSFSRMRPSYTYVQVSDRSLHCFIVASLHHTSTQSYVLAQDLLCLFIVLHSLGFFLKIQCFRRDSIYRVYRMSNCCKWHGYNRTYAPPQPSPTSGVS